MLSDLSIYKPWLTTVILPPGSLLLLIFFGYVMVSRSERVIWRALGKLCFMTSFLALWLLCCHGSAVFLERVALRPPLPVEPDSVTQTFKISQIQAIVVLGGGQQGTSLEYGKPALSGVSMQRLHYAAILARQTGVPLAFSGGVGWAGLVGSDGEAAAAARWLDALGQSKLLRWQESQSRDTAENAQSIAAVLKKDGIQSIALVTSAAHMPRALKEFERTGLKAQPFATSYMQPEHGQGLDWFPSGNGLRHTRQVLHEVLGLMLMNKSTPAEAK